MTAAQVIALNPTAFKETLESRVAELSDLLHTLTTELAILPLLRAGRKSPTLMTPGDVGVAPEQGYGHTDPPPNTATS